MVDNVLKDKRAFGYDEGFGTLAGRKDGDDGGLSEGVHFFELGGRKHGLLVAVEDFDGVVGLDGLKEPDDALGARLFEPRLFISIFRILLVDVSPVVATCEMK